MIFVFYIKNEYLDSFNNNEIFSIEKMKNWMDLEGSRYEMLLKPGEIRLFMLMESNSNQALFCNSIYSLLFNNKNNDYRLINSCLPL